MDLSKALKLWSEAIGYQNVLTTDNELTPYLQDTSGSIREVPAVLKVFHSDHLSKILTIANQTKVPLYPISTGHIWGYGTALPVKSGTVILDLSNLNQILDFDPVLGVVTVEPGVTQQIL